MVKKKVTIQDIAEKANVSKSTVSRVLNKSSLVKEHKRVAVLEAMTLLDFQPNQMARSLAGGRSMTVGVLTQDIGSPFYDLVARGVANVFGETLYSPIFADGKWNAEQEEIAIETLLDRRVDGLILIGGSMDVEELEKLQQQKPLIVVAKQIAGWEANCVFIDNRKGAYDATKYLIDCGHKKIAFIAGIESHLDSKLRKQGFEQAMQDAGLEIDRDLCVSGDFRPASGVAAAETLLATGKPFTAIFASNDEMACGARLALYRRDIKVPDEISLVGFDDQAMSAFMTPPLTSVLQPALQMGEVAGKTMINLLDSEPFEIPKLETKLMIRESVAKV